MQGISPLRIFTKDEIEDLSHETLIKYRKQKLLMFQLTDQHVIKVNENSVDKNTVLAIFNELEKTLDVHMAQYRIPQLKKFFSSKDTSAFYLILNVDFDQMEDHIRDSTIDRIAYKVNRQLGNDIKLGKIGPVNVCKISAFFNQHLGVNIDKAFSQVYTDLEDYTSTTIELFPQPFEQETGTVIYKEIENIINSNYAETLSSLPSSFDPVKVLFARWCHTITKEAFNRCRALDQFSIRTLQILKKSSNIAAVYFQTESHKANAKAITRFLNSKQKVYQGEESFLGTYGWAIAIAIFVIRMILQTSR